MTFILNIKPLSLHCINKQNRQRRYRTRQGNEYYSIIKKEIQKQMDLIDMKMTEEQIELEVLFVFDNNRANDLDNHLKSLLDAMEGVLYKNDKQIFKITCEKYVEDVCRIEITIKPYVKSYVVV